MHDNMITSIVQYLLKTKSKLVEYYINTIYSEYINSMLHVPSFYRPYFTVNIDNTYAVHGIFEYSCVINKQLTILC